MPASGINKPTRRRAIWAKTDGHCAHCGKIAYGNNKTIDHFIPKSEGGGYDRRNLMPLCSSCNKQRSSEPIDPKEFYKYAPSWAIEDCLDYEAEWSGKRRSLFDRMFG